MSLGAGIGAALAAAAMGPIGAGVATYMTGGTLQQSAVNGAAVGAALYFGNPKTDKPEGWAMIGGTGAAASYVTGGGSPLVVGIGSLAGAAVVSFS